MPSAREAGRVATAADLLAIPEHERFYEVVDGELVRKAMPSGLHGRAQSRVVTRIGGPYDRRPGGRWPGGWWIVTEVEVVLADHQVYRPDVIGWRRERLPELPSHAPIDVRPDWVCEVLSDSTEASDRGKKRRVYRREGVRHYWIVDPRIQTLEVYRLDDGRWRELDTYEGDAVVRAEPFESMELDLARLWRW